MKYLSFLIFDIVFPFQSQKQYQKNKINDQKNAFLNVKNQLTIF